MTTTADDAHEQRLWEALRRLSDAQLERVKQQLLVPHGSRISLAANDDDNQASERDDNDNDNYDLWRPSDLVHALVSYLHHAVHSQHEHAPALPAEANGTEPTNQRRSAKPTSSAPPPRKESPFALASADFPSLQPTATRPATANAPAKTVKRRITTTLVSAQSAVTRPVLVPVAFPATPPNAQTTNPWAKRELLERRMLSAHEPMSSSKRETAEDFPALSPPYAKLLPNATDVAPPPPRQLFDDSPPGGPKRVQPFPVPTGANQQPPAEPTSPTTPTKASSLPDQAPVLLGVQPKRPRRQPLLSAEPTLTHEPQTLTSAADVASNVPAAKLYAFVIAHRLVGSTCAELQLLTSLLFRTTCTDSPSSTRCLTTARNAFCWRPHCLAFAQVAFDDLVEPLLRHLGTELLQLLVTSLTDASVCVETCQRLEHVLQQREELRVAESARIGCTLPVETKASAVQDFALPFCEATDSRLHYRSPTDAAMYANRERVRDSFLALLRQFQRQQHALVGMESAHVAASAAASAHQLLADVAPANRWWFAKFFVLELLQVGANPFGESDKDLVRQLLEDDKLVGKNPDRLRKLHRRFSSHKQAPSAGATAVSGVSPTTNRGPTTKSSPPVTASGRGPTATRAAESTAKVSSASPLTSATFEAARSYFAENQQFFFHFLHSCDSYAFSQLVQCQLEAQFHAAWRPSPSPTGAADPRKSFTDVVLRLKALARFLGYLRFSPYWHHHASAVSTTTTKTPNPALAAAKKEAVWTLEHAESVGLDVKLLLEQSIADATVSKCVPWLCDYLTMLSLDKLSLATTYFQQLLVLLARLYRSSRLDALGETGVYVALQIERVFHVLDFDVATAIDTVQLQLPHLQPSATLQQLLDASVSSLSLSSSSSLNEDHLPFLYSQVFVQSCVSELEDLRGFLQTRAKPSHRVVKRTGGGGSHNSAATAPIRKLRPLQVVPESDDAASDDVTRATADSSRLSDDDKLADAVFKVHPTLRKVVDFIVEVVATNVCEHVLHQLVTPTADAFVQSCATESRVHVVRDSGSELDAATIVFLQLVETRTARSVADSVGRALTAALDMSDEKVRASIPHLLPPACHPTLAQSVARIALSRTQTVVRTLVPKSARSEFLKRVALQQKAVLKDAATASARLATAASEDDSVVRALSTLFDAHAGDDDDSSSQDELVAELKHTSAQIFTLCRVDRTAHASPEDWTKLHASPEDWTKLHASLARFVRSFTTSLTELLATDRSDRPESNDNDSADRKKPPQRACRLLHELSVWDPVWRVLSSCLVVNESFAVVVAAWDAADNDRQPTRVLAKAVDSFTTHVVSLLDVVSAHGSDDVEMRRRTARLLRVVVQATTTMPPALSEGDGSDNQATATSELGHRRLLAPRARIVAAATAFMADADGAEKRYNADTSDASRHDERQRGERC